MAERTSAQLTATLEAERERLQRDLTASNTRCDSLRKQVEHAKGMVLEARVRNKELETEIVQVNETGVALRRELEAARAKERALMEEVATLRARSREQDGQLRVAKAEMAQEKRGLMERIRELKENNGELAQREQVRGGEWVRRRRAVSVPR